MLEWDEGSRLCIQVVTHSAWRERRNIRSCVARVPADARQRGGQRGGDGRCDCGTQRVMAARTGHWAVSGPLPAWTTYPDVMSVHKVERQVRPVVWCMRGRVSHVSTAPRHKTSQDVTMSRSHATAAMVSGLWLVIISPSGWHSPSHWTQSLIFLSLETVCAIPCELKCGQAVIETCLSLCICFHVN